LVPRGGGGGGEVEEGRRRRGEGRGGVSRFARIWGRILNAYNSKTVRALQYYTLFAGILPGESNE